MPLPELRCKWDRTPKSITCILFNIKCEVGIEMWLFLVLPVLVYLMAISFLLTHTWLLLHLQIPFCRDALQTPLPVCNCVQCCSILAANPALGLFRFLALIDVISFIIGESLFLVFGFFGLFSDCWVAVQKGPTAGRGSQAGWYEYPEITGSSI